MLIELSKKYFDERMVNLTKKSLHIRRIAISAMFLSIALVLKTYFSFDIPMFGANGMRIGISGIFSIMPSILFGPIYGAAVSGLSDLLSYVIKPTGPYLPLLTLTAAAGGFMRGWFWQLIRDKNAKGMSIVVVITTILTLLFGIVNIAFLKSDGIDEQFYRQNVNVEEIDKSQMHSVSKFVITRTQNLTETVKDEDGQTVKDADGNSVIDVEKSIDKRAKNLDMYKIFVTYALIGIAVLGTILLLADLLISKKIKGEDKQSQIIQLLLAMIVSGLIVTTLNTVILRESMSFAAWKLLPFTVVWIPRVIEEILGNIVKTYFLAMLFAAFKKQKTLNALMK